MKVGDDDPGLGAGTFRPARSEVAVLSATGTVLAVNDTWRRYVVHAGAGPRGLVGSNYPALMSRAAMTGDEIAATACDTLEAVMEGHTHVGAMEYPCESSSGQHWFRLRVDLLLESGHFLIRHDAMPDHNEPDGEVSLGGIDWSGLGDHEPSA